MYWYDHGPDHMGYAWMGMGMLLLWALTTLVVVLVALRFAPRSRPDAQGSPARPAEQVLAQRFARGDIDEPEYLARLEVLRRPDR